MANTLISYQGTPTYLNNDDATTPYLATNASIIYLNADCSNMFNNCRNITNWEFLNNLNWKYITDCYSMFRSCYNFNQPINIPNNVNNCVNMFSNCPNMYSVVKLPNKFNNGITTAFWNDCPVSVENHTLVFY